MTCEAPGCTNEATLAEEWPNGKAFIRVCSDCAGLRAIPLDGPQWYGERLKQARELAGLSREELARMLNLSELSLWQIEQGMEPLTDEVIALLMTRCDVEVLVGFYEQKPLPGDDSLEGSSLLFHTPTSELCQICGVRFATALCDFRGCDKRLCDHCRVRPDEMLDFCPSHPVAIRLKGF